MRLAASFAAKQEHRHPQRRLQDTKQAAGRVRKVDPMFRNLGVREVGRPVQIERIFVEARFAHVSLKSLDSAGMPASTPPTQNPLPKLSEGYCRGCCDESQATADYCRTLLDGAAAAGSHTTALSRATQRHQCAPAPRA